MPVVALMSDLGGRDFYLPQVKGYLLGRFPAIQLIDITHEIDPHGLLMGAVVLRNVFDSFASGTVFITCVGHSSSTASPLLATLNGRYLLCCDNGLLPLVCGDDWEPEWIGRLPASAWQMLHPMLHVMAPAALRLIDGDAPTTLADTSNEIRKLQLPRPMIERDRILGEVLYVDRFGNAITNIAHTDILRLEGNGKLTIEAGYEHIRGISTLSADVPEGELAAMFGSHGKLEIAIHLGKASPLLGLKVGTAVIVRSGD